MMMLSRKIGESIQINENVKVTVVSVRGKTVRVAISAPREVAIRRSTKESDEQES